MSKKKKLGIATARIYGLEKSPYYWDHGGYYVCDIYFRDSSTLSFNNIPNIRSGITIEEANEFFKRKIKKNFEKLGITNKSVVSILFDQESNAVVAIGSSGNSKWIDVNDNFKVKTFKQLNVSVKSLTVYC